MFRIHCLRQLCWILEIRKYCHTARGLLGLPKTCLVVHSWSWYHIMPKLNPQSNYFSQLVPKLCLASSQKSSIMATKTYPQLLYLLKIGTIELGENQCNRISVSKFHSRLLTIQLSTHRCPLLVKEGNRILTRLRATWISRGKYL